MRCKCVVLWAGTVSYEQITQTIAQANAARIECFIEEIPELEYEGMHRERPAHLRDELSGSEVMEKGIQNWGRCARQ